jgi:hypothetical protein
VRVAVRGICREARLANPRQLLAQHVRHLYHDASAMP